jgi:hypothetical protein
MYFVKKATCLKENKKIGQSFQEEMKMNALHPGTKEVERQKEKKTESKIVCPFFF